MAQEARAKLTPAPPDKVVGGVDSKYLTEVLELSTVTFISYFYKSLNPGRLYRE